MNEESKVAARQHPAMNEVAGAACDDVCRMHPGGIYTCTRTT